MTGEETTMRQQQPLSREEAERLWRWERQMSWLHIGAMGCLLLASVAAYRLGDFAWLQRPLLAGLVALVVAAAVLQFRGRCPRCGVRVRSRILRMLPDKCGKCGIEFPRPPA